MGKRKMLNVGNDLKIPAEDFLEGATGIIGKRGRGKSGLVKVIMEELCRLKMPFVSLDPVGIQWGIRSSFSGKGEGFKVLVIGGQHGDLKLDRRAGAEVARAVVQANVSCIIDFSDEPKSVYRQFVQDFSDTLYRINDAPRHVIVEEAPELVPQRLRPDMTAVFEAVERLVSRGRNKGIGVTLVSQRAATIAKDVLTQVDTMIVFGLTSPQDRKAIREWVECKADPSSLEKFENGLAALKRQEAWIWSPESFELFRAFRVRNMTTFHPDKTHLRRSGMLSLKPVETDVSGIVKNLGDTMARLAKTKEAEADSPVLKQKVAQLERQLEVERSKKAVAAPCKDCAAAKTEIRRLEAQVEKMLRHAREIVGVPIEAEAKRIVKLPPFIKAQNQVVPVDGAISQSQVRILEALRYLKALGMTDPTKTSLALWAGCSPKSGGYFNNLGRLRTLGYIDYPAPSRVKLTDSGFNETTGVFNVHTDQDMHEQVFSMVGKSKAAILKRLIVMYPNAISKDELANSVECSPTSGGYFNNLGALRSMGLIEYVGPKMVKATEAMFLQ